MVHSRYKIVILIVGFLLLSHIQGKERLVKGKVIRREGKNVEINVGARDGVKPGMQFQVFTGSRTVYLPFSGKNEREVLIERKPIATVIVRKLYQTHALCELVSSTKGYEIIAGQTVVEIETRFAEPQNVTPFIDGIEIASSVFCGQLTKINCKVTDANDKSHLYFWRVSGGRVYPTKGVCGEAYWIAPAKPGRYELSVTVVDPQGAKARKEVTVSVKAHPSIDPMEFEPQALFGYVYPPFFQVASIAFDEKGRMVLLDSKARRLIFFDFDNQPLRTSPPYLENQNYVALYTAAGRYFLTEANSCSIHIYNHPEEIFKSKPDLIIGYRGTGNGYFLSPPIVRVHPTDGRLYALDRAAGSIQVFELDGSFVKSFGRRGNTQDAFIQPITMEFSPNGELLVLDGGRKDILIFKKELFTGVFPLKEPLTNPVDMRIDRFTGKLLVLERSHISLIDREGNVMARFGDKGGLGRIQEPSALYLSLTGVAYVRCKEGKVLKRYSTDGHFLGSVGDAKLYPIKDIAVSKEGEMFFLLKDNRIARLTEDGYVLSIFAGYGRKKGRLLRPVAMGVDDDGNLYVADSSALSIIRFSLDGSVYTIKGGTERQERIDNIVDMEVVGDRIYLLQDRRTYAVLVFSTEGRIVAHYPSRDFPIYGAWRIAVEPSGKTYVFSGRELGYFDVSGQRYDRDTGIRYDINDILVSPSGDVILATEEEFLLRLSPSSHLKKRLSGVKLIEYPLRLAIDGYGRLYVLDGRKSFVCRLIARYGE